MLDLHLLLYAGMLGGGESVNALGVIAASESKRLHNIGIPIFKCRPSAFDKCDALCQGDFFFVDRPPTWFYVLASVYECEECDDL